MRDKDLALEALYDFMETASEDYGIPDDMYRLAKLLAEFLRNNDRAFAYDYYMQNYEDIDELFFDYMKNNGSIAYRNWLEGK